MKRKYSLPGFVLFVCCFFGQVSHSQIITRVAGNGTRSSGGDGSPATAASLGGPNSVAVDTTGNVYIADGNEVRKINTSGIITRIGGGGSTSATTDGDGGPATDAYFNDIWGIAVDRYGNIFASDRDMNLIRKISPSGIISTVAGDTTGWSYGATYVGGFSGDGGPASLAVFAGPHGLALDTSGNLYIADRANARVRKVTLTGIITTIAGCSSAGTAGDGGPATAAQLSSPTGVAVDKFGNIYISDEANNNIRKINASGIISTFAGNGTDGSSGDGGPATAAEISEPFGVTVDDYGNVYISDNDSYIRKVNISGVISTYAGNGTPGITGDGGPATAAEIDGPEGLAVDATGNLYIADAAGATVRRVSECMPNLGLILGSASLCFSSTTVLVDTPSGGAWSSSNTTVATINSSGVVSGLTPGIDTITYSKTNSCGTSIEHHIITVDPTPNAGTITGIDSVCPGSFDTLINTGTGGSWITTSSATATVSATGIVTGLTPGMVTIKYIVSNACGTDTASYSLRVRGYVPCISGTAKVESIQAAMSIYPNPNRGAFTISIIGQDLEQVPVIVTNILGQKVWEMKITANRENEIQLHVPAGVYFISANTASGRLLQKFVIE